MTQTIGVIGSGHLVKHMMPALIATGARFVISKRGTAVSSELSRTFGVEVSDNNQSIVDQSDIVILAVRPFDAVAVSDALTFGPDQTVLSLCAGITSSELAPSVGPANLVMAMPVVAAEFAESPTLMFPEDPHCRAILETCGPVLTLEREEQFGPASTIACYYGWLQELILQMADWVSAHGVDPETARMLTAQMTRAAGTTVRERATTPIPELVSQLATPRSYTLKGLEVLREADAFAPWKTAADALYRQD